MPQSKWFPYLLVAAAVAAVLIAAGVPLAAFLPFVFVLACPLMMVVMMRGMGGMHGRHSAPPALRPIVGRLQYRQSLRQR